MKCFSQREYLQKLIEIETSKVKFSGQRVFHRTKVEKGVPLVVTYHPLFKTIGKIIHNLYLLYTKNLNTFLHQVLWFPSEALGRSEVIWLELSCIQLKCQWGLIIVKDHVVRFVHMLIRQFSRPPKMENFFGRNNKSRSSAFRKFLFYQNIICFD